jgi:CubicO group peptidase (beta-lactamase class C family)
MRSLKAEHRPGSQFNYNTGDTYVLGSLISAATGKTLADYMSEMIWSRLGMEFDAFYTLESEAGQEIGGSRAGIALRILAASAYSFCATASSMARPCCLWTGSNMPDARPSSSIPRPIAMGRRDMVTAGGLIPMGRWSPSALPASRST